MKYVVTVAVAALLLAGVAGAASKEPARYVNRLCVGIEKGTNFPSYGDLNLYRGKDRICIVGKNGKPGKAGKRGPKGADGVSVSGAAGAKGDQGERGAQGAAGKDGAQGETGKDGAQGEPGSAGSVGPQSRQLQGEPGERPGSGCHRAAGPGR